MKYHVEFRMPAYGRRDTWCIMAGSYTTKKAEAKKQAAGLKQHFNIDTMVVDRQQGEVVHQCRAARHRPYMAL